MPPIEPAYLMAAGIFLIGLEIVLYSFFIIWIGIGLILVGLLSFVITFADGYYQLAIAFTTGAILLYLLRGWAMRLVEGTQSSDEEQVHEHGIGIVDGGMIRMDGTYWQSDSDLSVYKDGDRVEVIEIKNNRVILEKGEKRQ